MEVGVFNLADLSRSLATRMKGKEAAWLFSDFVAKNGPGTIVVGWHGVSAASPSFIDEFVKGIQEITQEESCSSSIVFTGEDTEIISLVDTILRRREFPVSYAAKPDDLDIGPVSILGGASGQIGVLV